MTNEILSLDECLKQNSNLVYSICSKYQGYRDKEDLHQVGMIGLINAYNNFDKEKNVKFSTYTVPMVIGEIKRYIRDNGAIKVSRNLKILANKINRYIDEYYSNNNDSPSINDIAKKAEVGMFLLLDGFYN